MRGIASWFFISAVVYVTLGMVFGLWMSASHDHQLGPAHGHLNLVGWVTMALFGIFYHLVPEAGQTRLATLHFAAATLGIWLMVPGIGLAIMGRTELLAVLGSFLTMGSMLIFLFTVAKYSRGRLA
jgi:cbb3-type cytochrome oxidase subunit 1